MSTALLRRGTRAAAVVALAFVTMLSGMTFADALDSESLKASGPVEISIGAAGITAPSEAPSGLVSFHVTTDDATGRLLHAVRLRPGVTLEAFFTDLTKLVSRVPAAGAEASAAVRDEAEWLGGASVTPAVPATFTTPVSAGQVVLVDFTAFLRDPAHPVHRTMTLGKAGVPSLTAFPGSFVIAEQAAGGPRFEAQGTTRAKDPILVHNASDEIHEMVLQPVAAGTTDVQLQTYFDNLLKGTATEPWPFSGPSYGLGAISPGRTAMLQQHGLPPGTYVLLCYVPSARNGLPHTFLGMHKVVVLT
ncbi:hypothetical protein ACGFYQ_36940 [Streptomyces sp. NPDC048258]|uniref:hypothetical protein n=1 Tax=Streptomyces sp. NPDC048258 TaxID=3365527 RepID=UPI00371B361B